MKLNGGHNGVSVMAHGLQTQKRLRGKIFGLIFAHSTNRCVHGNVEKQNNLFARPSSGELSDSSVSNIENSEHDVVQGRSR